MLQIIVQISVGHYPVYLDAIRVRESQNSSLTHYKTSKYDTLHTTKYAACKPRWVSSFGEV